MMATAAPNRIPPDLEMAARFLDLLDETAESWTFQVFDDLKTRKDRGMARMLTGSLAERAESLERANAAGCGVFVTVNETDGKGRRLDNITRVRAIWHEQDHAAPAGFPLEPHIVVESSPGKFHRYWLVEGLAQVDFSGVMERMVCDYGSDPNVKDLARVLRLPGFWHLKEPGRPFMSRLVESSGAQPYSAAQILQAFPPIVSATPAAPVASSDSVPEAHKALVTELASRAAKRTHEMPTLGRHAMVLWLGRECAHRGVPASVAGYAVRVFERLMRPCDASGVIAGMNFEAECKAFADAHAKGLADPPEKRKNYMPRPVSVLPSAAGAPDGARRTEEGAGGGGNLGAPEWPPEADDDRPEIVVGGDRLITAMQQAERVLFATPAVPYYVRGGILTRVSARTKRAADGSEIPAVPVLEPVSPIWLRQSMMRACRFVSVKAKMDKDTGEEKLVRAPVNLPKDYPETYCAWSVSDWWAPELRAIVEAPVLFRDGSILSQSGYHPASRLLLASSEKWALPPKRKPGAKVDPGRDLAIEEAAQIFRDLFWGPDRFSPATPEDYASMIAAVLTTLIKTEIGASPGWVVTAPIWGSGKGKFVDIVSIVRTGRRAAMMTMPTSRRNEPDEAKLEDQLFAALLEGGGLVVIDEVQRTLQSTTLRSMVTAEEYTARVKGVSKMATVRPIDSQWMVLGNNLNVSADDARRWLRVYLDPKTDAPHLRRFDRDCLEHATVNRARIVWAALTLMQGYIHAGMPDQGCRLGGYERWAALVPSCLVWAGFANPLDTMAAWMESDPDRQRLGALLAAWRAYFGEDSVTAKVACKEVPAGGSVPENRIGREMARDTLLAALEDICGEQKGGLNSRLLGGYLSARQERRVDTLRFVKDGTYQGAVRWRVAS